MTATVGLSPIEKVLRALDGTAKQAKTRRDFTASYQALCPCHDDRSPSLDIDVNTTGKVLLLCRVCGPEATPGIVGRLHLTMNDLFPGSNGTGRHYHETVYDYTDAQGKLLYQVVRREPGKTKDKDFLQRHPDGRGGWIWDMKGVQRVLYRLPRLYAAPADAPVFIVEGEKCVRAIERLGLVATCNSGGAEKFPDDGSHVEPLKGRTVYILPDNDAKGRKHAQQVQGILHRQQIPARVALLPGLGDKEDVHDWARRGGTREQLLELCQGKGDSGDSGPREEWPPPIPLDDAPDVPSFPLEVLPARLASLCEQMASAMNCPPDFVAVAQVALAGGALANSTRLAITSTHTQSPSLYVCLVAPPGATKTPPLRALRHPFDARQEEQLRAFAAELKAWEEKEEDRRGRKPIPQRCVVSNATTESLVLLLAENPRGLLMVRNELAELMTGMNQYKGGKGQDRQVFLNLWDGDTIINDRKSDKARHGAPQFVLGPFLSIAGTIQPDVLELLRGETFRGQAPANDGFIDRFLFSFPADIPARGETWVDVPEEELTAWKRAIFRLLGRDMVKVDGQHPVPRRVDLTRCGRQAWETFTRDLAGQVNAPDLAPFLRGPWAKMKGNCARLALILHYLRWATGEVAEDALDVSGDSMTRAATLVGYFQGHARKVYAVAGANRRANDARKVQRWFLRERLEQFTKRDAYQALKGTFKTVEELEPVLVLMEKHCLVREAGTPDRSGAGRKPSPVYEVNPQIFSLGTTIPTIPTIGEETW